MDIQLHTNGFGLGYTTGKIETWYRTSYYYINIGSIKHAKELTQNSRFPGSSFFRESSKPFIYGKQNRLYAIRAGIGKRKSFSERDKQKSVVVGVNYSFGPTIGILKPYYLKLKQIDQNTANPSYSVEKYSEENAAQFLDRTLIYGGAEFKYGLRDLKIRPGIHGKLGVNFSWGEYNQFFKALELGVMGDLFLSSVPLMILEQNRPYFINLYINLQLGRRS